MPQFLHWDITDQELVETQDEKKAWMCMITLELWIYKWLCNVSGCTAFWEWDFRGHRTDGGQAGKTHFRREQETQSRVRPPISKEEKVWMVTGAWKWRRITRSRYSERIHGCENYLNFYSSDHLTLPKEPENKVYRQSSQFLPLPSEAKIPKSNYPSTVSTPSSGLHFDSLWPKCTFALGYDSTAEGGNRR